MFIVTPISDYIQRTLLTIENQIVVRGAAQPEARLGILRALGIEGGLLNRNAGGNQVIGGLTHQPSVVIFLAVDMVPANNNWCAGFGLDTMNGCIFNGVGGTQISIDIVNAMWIYRAAPNSIRGRITAWDETSFTINWVLVGGCQIRFLWLALP